MRLSFKKLLLSAVLPSLLISASVLAMETPEVPSSVPMQHLPRQEKYKDILDDLEAYIRMNNTLSVESLFEYIKGLKDQTAQSRQVINKERYELPVSIMQYCSNQDEYPKFIEDLKSSQVIVNNTLSMEEFVSYAQNLSAQYEQAGEAINKANETNDARSVSKLAVTLQKAAYNVRCAFSTLQQSQYWTEPTNEQRSSLNRSFGYLNAISSVQF